MNDPAETPEYNILLQCIRLDDPEGAARKAEAIIRSGAVDWEGLYERAKAHCVRPQLARMMNSITSPEVPGTFREKLNDYYRQNLSLQLRNVAGYLRLKDMLDGEGIRAIPFKGFSLAQAFCDSLADREGTDVDLFFDFNDFDRLTVLMAQNGYKPEASSSPAFIKKIKKESAEYNFERYEEGEIVFHVEFHWKVGSSAHGLDISLADLAGRTAMVPLQGRDVEMFSPPAALLLAVMHHGGKDPFLWLKHVNDIGLILNKNAAMDWDWVISMARRYDAERLLYMTLRMAMVMTGTEVDEKLKTALQADNIGRLADERMKMMQADPRRWDEPAYRYRNLIFHLRSRTRLKTRAVMLWQGFRSAVVGILAPKKLLRVYLKKRYDIERHF